MGIRDRCDFSSKGYAFGWHKTKLAWAQQRVAVLWSAQATPLLAPRKNCHGIEWGMSRLSPPAFHRRSLSLACLLRLAAHENEPEFLTNLRLQKLMYYVQGWSLAMRNRPAFKGRIEAWAHGPVVKELYARLAQYGDQAILADHFQNLEDLSPEDQEFVAAVWDAYKGFSAFALRQMTHGEPPWIKARGAAGPADRCETEITHDDMREFFLTKGKKG